MLKKKKLRLGKVSKGMAKGAARMAAQKPKKKITPMLKKKKLRLGKMSKGMAKGAARMAAQKPKKKITPIKTRSKVSVFDTKGRRRASRKKK